MDFFDRAKARAKELGLGIRDVVELAGENYDSYNSMKRYSNLPRADVVVAMANILKTTAEFLVTGAEPKNHAAEKLEEIKKIMDR